jgi:RNA polymerase sigma factor (sigma-70 family)
LPLLYTAGLVKASPPPAQADVAPAPRAQGAGFPATRGSLLAAVGADDPAARHRAWDELLRSYWKAVHRYLCLRWRARPEQAEDWTQEFLARAVERGTFEAFDPAKARFRTFLRLCLDRWVANQLESAARLKRGGGEQDLSLDALPGSAEPAATTDDPEELFHREWLRSLFESAIDALQQSCAGTAREVRWRLFARYDLGEVAPGEAAAGERPSYAALAAEEGLPVTQVTNHLAWARRELRRLLLEELRQQTASDGELRDEARRVLGADLP